MNKKKMTGLIALGAALGAAAAAAAVAKNKRKKFRSDEKRTAKLSPAKKAYLIGGGLSNLACAVYLIHECNFAGENIYIFESSLNRDTGTDKSGCFCLSEMCFNENAYKSFLNLMSIIPSAYNPDLSAADEIYNFSRTNPLCANTAVADKNGNVFLKPERGLERRDRKQLFKLMHTSDSEIRTMTVSDWFDSQFFNSDFWNIWSCNLYIKQSSNLKEFKDCMSKYVFNAAYGGKKPELLRTPYNTNESIIKPLIKYLSLHGVCFETGAEVTDLDFEDNSLTVSALHITDNGTRKTIYLNSPDICIMTAGSPIDGYAAGDFASAPLYGSTNTPAKNLLNALANKNSVFADVLNNIEASEKNAFESFTVTMKSNRLQKYVREIADSSAAKVHLRDSAWGITVISDAQPRFTAQNGTYVFSGFGMYPDRIGNYVKKPMKDCCGAEILYELICHLNMHEDWESIADETVNVIPCYLPFAAAAQHTADKLPVTLENTPNFALTGQLTDIDGEPSFTAEHSVISGRNAAYALTHTKKTVQINRHTRKPSIFSAAWKKINF